MRLKYLILVIGLSLLWITGCSNGMDKEVDVNNKEFPPSMTGIIIVKDKEYEMEAGNYKWERQQGSDTEVVQTDSASPYERAENFSAIMLEQNTNIEIEIEIEENPKMSAYLWNENGRKKEVILNNNQLSAPTSKGQYIYEVLAEWSNGEVSYTFVVEVN